MTATVTAGARTADAWRQFAGSGWRERIDVRDFIQANYTPYEGDASFLAGPTDRTRVVWEKVNELFPEERRRGVLDVDAATPSTITSHAPGFIDRDRELIVGLQTDAPPQARDHAGRRPAHGGERTQGVRLRARPVRHEGVRLLPQDPQRGRVRRLHPRHARRPQGRHHHRAARRLRPWPDHR